jgi:ribosomal protein S18 acetylase RimI-like enzyme
VDNTEVTAHEAIARLREDGTRTFALSEIMVRRAYTGQGIAHALHDELLGGRSEERATLLVRPANTFAYRAYTGGGGRKSPSHAPAGRTRPRSTC